MKRYVFDLDNTIVFTDLLNNESYNHALKKLGLEPINNCLRITRDIIFNKYPYLSDAEKIEIIAFKQEYFANNLDKTYANNQLLKLLEVQNLGMCILWTSADEARVLAILKYYRILNAFKNIVFSNKSNIIQDVEKICELFGCSLEHLIFYEDNAKIIRELQELKINVIPISKGL